MSCPKCGGFVTFDVPMAVRVFDDSDGIELYYKACCEDCPWTGIGVKIYDLENDDYDYIDDYELPDPAEDVAFFGNRPRMGSPNRRPASRRAARRL